MPARIGDWARVDAMFDRLDAVRGGYPDDAEIALQEAKAAVNVTSDAGADRDWARVDAMFDRLDAVRGGYPDDAEIALHEAMAATNIANYSAEADDWDRVSAMRHRIKRLVDRWGMEFELGQTEEGEVQLADVLQYIDDLLEERGS